MTHDKHTLQWWMSPRRDKNYQWWWGYEKVHIVKLPDSEKQKFLDWHNSVNLEEKDG